MFSFKPAVRRLVVSLVSVIAALSLVSDKAAAVADEGYFIDIYLAAQSAASAKRSTELIIERGVPPDVAFELYRKAQVCYGKVLFKHVTAPRSPICAPTTMAYGCARGRAASPLIFRA